MSLESLLDALTVPRVPCEKNAGEPPEAALINAGSPGSLGSLEKTSPPDEILVAACRGLTITPLEVTDRRGYSRWLPLDENSGDDPHGD